MRKNGYYWVIEYFKDFWTIAHFEKGYGWTICGSDDYYDSDRKFKQIDEQIIIKSNEN